MRWWDAGRGLGGLGRKVCIPRMGVPLLPPDSMVTPEGSSAPHVLNESLVLVTELHEDSSVLKQVDPGPWGQGTVKRASFRPASAGWGRGCRGSEVF